VKNLKVDEIISISESEMSISLLKSRVGNIIAKASALRVNLNLDGAPIASRNLNLDGAPIASRWKYECHRRPI
jgi:hypothetical protein